MRKILLSSLLLSSLVLADKIAIPMSASSLAVENSGTKIAIDAYQDGVGIYTVEQIGGTVIDNSEMNSLVYKYGAEAKIADVNIKDYILSSGNAAEKVLAGKLGKFKPIKPIAPGNGTVCDDKNASTINDKYVNGVCIGENICNDNNILTNNDRYLNNVCSGDIINLVNNYALVNAFPNNPNNNYNWSYSGQTYTSTGQFSSKFFKLPQSGIIRIKFNLAGVYFFAGITSKPSYETFSNIHISETSDTFSKYFINASIDTTGIGIYYLIADMDNKIATLTRENGTVIYNNRTISSNNEVFFGIADHASANGGSINFLELKTN